ncbi:large conductance mechanosensitive channel [Actinopolymorpha cephalotaxi]|uniref:Large-conductance mechanosensitive channel n=1 Tax=Actinopolymorpha cephalotaxi TaxID=504797 RepID=A0A1I2LUQ2_9ACTN|nr:large conductance mechanosensitive channel protein MscL [Actinopolymorpha cephalotaxi]NYH81458.1 large conductance mechanosensitive channel [Actinopolymorpha cephalotaxi]SFF82984.1 large conductance mechanosensitive channel [Actinopolymorpha cephalotaxi]
MFKGFKQFLMRGNVLDLAVAVVLGAAFTKIVTGLLDGFINPLVAAIFGQPDLTKVGHFTVHNAQFSLGLIIDAVFNFLIIAATIYFLVVVPVNRLAALRRHRHDPEAAPEIPPAEDILLLRDIRDLLAEAREQRAGRAGDQRDDQRDGAGDRSPGPDYPPPAGQPTVSR